MSIDPASTEPANGVSAAEFAAELDDHTPAGIAAAVSRRIRSGALAPGSRLPTVREVARELKVSPATVNQAWRALAATGALIARGRAGTFVGETLRPNAPVGRYQRLHPPSDSAFRIDLSRGTPDPELLPDLTAALRVLIGGLPADERLADGRTTDRHLTDGHLLDEIPADHRVNPIRRTRAGLAADYLAEPMLPELAATVRADWPFRPEHLAVLDGAMDAIDRLLGAHVRLGDAVAVEDPCFPPFLDLLARLGARPIPVRMDEAGLLPHELARAVGEHSATALILQPRAQNPTGVSLTARRVRELADILQHSATLILEDDHSAGIAAAPLRSLGTRLPRRTVHIRSYSKSHGADLRLAVAGGPIELLDPVIERRMLGPGWSSRLLQRVLLAMLSDHTAVAAVDTARAEYRRRSAELRRALARRDIHIARGDGINLWLPVADENAAMISLAAAGIKVAPGGPFEIGEPQTDHLRLTISPVADTEIDWLVTELVTATAATPTYRRIRRI